MISLIKSRGWWNDTLVVFSSDNGAPLDVSEAAGECMPCVIALSTSVCLAVCFMVCAVAVIAGGRRAGGNYPLLGGKYANWQGGVSVPAVVSGGYLPATVRGTVNNGESAALLSRADSRSSHA